MIKIGDTVLCRLYNTPERKFYGEYFQAEVLKIDMDNNHRVKCYLVKHPNTFGIWLHRKEIKRIIK